MSSNKAALDCWHCPCALNDQRAYLGRKPTFDRAQYQAVRDMLDALGNLSHIARATGLKRQTVFGIRADPVAAEKTLAAWGL
jgi:putative DNA-invertase from lambdoid prophage Rac